MGGDTEWGLPLRHRLSSLLPREPGASPLEWAESVLPLSSSHATELEPVETPLPVATGGNRDSRGCREDTTGVAEVTVPGGRGKPNTCFVGAFFSLGDMSPLLGDLGKGRGRGDNEEGRSCKPPPHRQFSLNKHTD